MHIRTAVPLWLFSVVTWIAAAIAFAAGYFVRGIMDGS